MFQMKEQDKTLKKKKGNNKMAIRNYRRVKCSGHKEAHQTQEKNAGENFNKEIGNTKKNQSEL